MGETSDSQPVPTTRQQPPLPPQSSASNLEMGIWKKVFHHPNFNALCGIVTIIGTLLGAFGIWAYFASIREPNLTYYVSPTRAAFVQKKNLNNFEVKYQGLAITGDLSSAEIQIWNNGKAAIHKSDILKPITLKTPNGEPFYTEIYSNDDIVGFELLNNSNKQSGVLTMDWKILQHNDAIKLQVIYGGGVDLALTLDGAIEGQQRGIKALSGKHKPDAFLDLIVGGVGFSTIAYIILDLSRQRRNSKKQFVIGILIIAMMLVQCFALLYNYLTALPKPPFGF